MPKKQARDNWEGDKAGYPRDKQGYTTMPLDPAARLVSGGTAKDKRRSRDQRKRK